MQAHCHYIVYIITIQCAKILLENLYKYPILLKNLHHKEQDIVIFLIEYMHQ